MAVRVRFPIMPFESRDVRFGSRLCENAGGKSVGATIDSAIADA